MKITYAPGATPLDPDELAGLVPSSISTQGELNDFEQANNAEAGMWAMQKKRKDCLSEAFLRDLHRRMFRDVWKWAGSYRQSDKNIGVPWSQIVGEVSKLCGDVRYWIEHTTYPWDELGVRFHHRLVQIHPFPNGNGRHARLMTDVLLKNNDQELFTWGNGQLDEPNETRERYLTALRSADARQYEQLIQFVRS
jgi:Fic-DOC domain mobile mystery protein B